MTQEDIFCQMVQKYCGQEEGILNSNVQANNYGLISLPKDSEPFKDTKSTECGLQWTNILEILILGILLTVIAKMA